ncbi:MAG TPA: hypothetical protein VGG85_07125, partial [Terracidiphilus sp.]
MDRDQTLATLDELQRRGFNDEAFWLLHHWRVRNDHETIRGFRTYSMGLIHGFKDGDTNERVG